MKTRNGFVSNSSTSSFVVVGFYLDATNYSDRQLVSTLDCAWMGKNPDLVVYDDKYFGTDDDGNSHIPKGKYLIGAKMNDIENDGCGTALLQDKLARVAKAQELLGLDPQAHPLILFHYLSGM